MLEEGLLDVGDACLLYTSDAADDLLCVDLGGRRIIKKKKTPTNVRYHKYNTQQPFSKPRPSNNHTRS